MTPVHQLLTTPGDELRVWLNDDIDASNLTAHRFMAQGYSRAL